MCNQIAALSGRKCGTVDYGWPGASYGQLKKDPSPCPDGGSGTPNSYFNDSIGVGTATCPALDDPGVNLGIIAVKAVVDANPGTWSGLVVPGVYFNQGETEWAGSPGTTGAAYKLLMEELQGDYETSINAAISQSGLVPLFINQKSMWTTRVLGSASRTTPLNLSSVDGVPIGQLQAALDNYSTGKIFITGPEYAEDYFADGYHMQQPANVSRGRREGWIVERVTKQGIPVRPFYPRAITISGTSMDVQFWVPNGDLELDTTWITPPADGFHGFELSNGASITLSSVAKKSGTTDSVRLTLSDAPPSNSTAFELRYAWTGTACPDGAGCSTTGFNYTGRVGGPRGTVAGGEILSWDGVLFRHFALTFKITGISIDSPHSWAPADPDLSTIPGVQIASTAPTGSVKGGNLIRR